jgi:large subunit ribosomal protein L29
MQGETKKTLAEFKAKSPEELKAALLALRQSQFTLRMQAATGQAVKSHLITKNRKDVARLKTLLNQKGQ